MAESVLPYALTTVARIKNRLTITASSFDTMFLRLVNAATEYVETECDRRFIETTYSNEVYSVDKGDTILFLRNYPVTTLTSVEYRAGLNSTPNWTAYLSDNYYLLDRGQTGIIQFDGSLVSGPNVARATYVAGYKINWANAGDNSTHTLPADLTDLCERLIVRLFKRREAEGKSAESFEGGSVNWLANLDDEDKSTLEKYKRMTLF